MKCLWSSMDTRERARDRDRDRDRGRERERSREREGGREGRTDRQTERLVKEEGRVRAAVQSSPRSMEKPLGDVTPLYKKARVVCIDVRNYNSTKLQAKIIGTKDHTCNSTSKQHWTDIFKTNQNNRTSLYYRTHEFISSLNNSFLSPSFPGSPPWISKEVDIDISLSDQINKKTDNP